MSLRSSPFRSIIFFVLSAGLAGIDVSGAESAPQRFHKQHLEAHYWSEGACFGDLNKDGHQDAVYGPYWWEGPDFTKRHEIYPATRTFRINRDDVNGEVLPGFPGALSNRNSYASDNFFAFVYDFNGDGFGDVLNFGMPNAPALLYLNPRGRDQIWERHLVLPHVDNESPTFVDLTGDGRPEIVCVSGGNFGYASPDWTAPTAPWTFVPITAEGSWLPFTHGLGVGDVNGDGRLDVLFGDGWLEQPASLAGNPIWTKHNYHFAPAGAQMYAYDVSGDGRNDIITVLDAHGYGLAWYEQRPETDPTGRPQFIRHTILGAPEDVPAGLVFSEPHALALVDLDHDGLRDLVVGKCFWSHGPRGAPGSDQPAVLFWLKLVRSDKGVVTWVPKLIDDDSGVGRQIGVGDANGDGRPDLITGNKKGVFVFIQQPGEARGRSSSDSPAGWANTISEAKDVPAANVLRVSRPGTFFTATVGHSRYEAPLATLAGCQYERATIEFDADAPSFPGPALHGILALVDPDRRSSYFALQHTVRNVAEKGIRTLIDNKAGGFSAHRTDLLERVRAGGARLHYRVAYNTREKSVTVEIVDRFTGERESFVETCDREGGGLVEENAIMGTSRGLILQLGLDRVYDKGGYFPPYGWSFANLQVELYPASAEDRGPPVAPLPVVDAAQAGGRRPIRVIIDADTANEIDDFYAIVRALLAPELRVEGLTAAAFRPPPGDVSSVAQSQACNEAILSRLNLTAQVPALTGAEGGLVNLTTPLDSPAARFIIARAHAGAPEDPLWVIALGQCTNLASALLLDPTIAPKVRFAFIDGDFKEGRWGPGIYNWRNDIAAVQVLFGSQVAYFHMPARSVSGTLKMSKGDAIAHLRGRGAIHDYLLGRWESLRPDRSLWTMWDLALVEAIIRPDLAQMAEVGAPIIHGVDAVEQFPDNPRRVKVWTKIDAPEMLADFWQVLDRHALQR